MQTTSDDKSEEGKYRSQLKFIIYLFYKCLFVEDDKSEKT